MHLNTCANKKHKTPTGGSWSVHRCQQVLAHFHTEKNLKYKRISTRGWKRTLENLSSVSTNEL